MQIIGAGPQPTNRKSYRAQTITKDNCKCRYCCITAPTWWLCGCQRLGVLKRAAYCICAVYQRGRLTGCAIGQGIFLAWLASLSGPVVRLPVHDAECKSRHPGKLGACQDHVLWVPRRIKKHHPEPCQQPLVLKISRVTINAITFKS